MKLIEHFDTFLKEVVNLNQTRIYNLESHVEAIKRCLRRSNYNTKITRFSRQGSWAHKTIIKPCSSKEFDADLVMFVKRNQKWEVKDYVKQLYQIFRNLDRYKDKVYLGTRCVTLDYADDFHLDIVPCIVPDDYSDIFQVCNHRDNRFECTNPEEYTKWLLERNKSTGNNRLRHSIRLIKYLRDSKGTFSAKSILLTTLIGQQVFNSDINNQAKYFTDIPTSLKTLIGRLDNYLKAYDEMPVVINPVLPEESFNRHWDQKKYENFRECVKRYRTWIDDAYDEQNREESIRKWRKIFGESFASNTLLKKNTSSITANNSIDAVTTVSEKGSTIIQRIISFELPHVESPKWPFSNRLSVTIQAKEYINRNDFQSIKSLQSGDILPKGHCIRFEARSGKGYPLNPKDFTVKWQVVNTDKEAAEESSLRGDFYKSDEPGVRWEDTLYRGIHWVEAFVISLRDHKCWGKSGKFFIVVQ